MWEDIVKEKNYSRFSKKNNYSYLSKVAEAL